MTEKARGRRSRQDLPYHHGDLRSALLEAALALVRSGGPESVSLRKIAEKAGVSEAAPYHHFRSKDELLAFAAAQSFARLEERMRMAAGGAGRGDPAGAFIAIGRAYMEYGLDEPGRFRLLFGKHMQALGLDSSVRAAGRKTVLLATDLAAAWVRHARAGIDPVRLFRLAWGQIHGLTWLVLEQEIEISGRAQALSLLEEGLGLLLRGTAAGFPNRRAGRR